MNLPVEIYSVESVRRIDDAAINQAGIGGYELMTRAAQAALDAARRKFPEAKRWQIVCGPGNNGGDGYVLARLAAQKGIAVSVLAATPPDALSGDAKTAFHDLAAQGGVVGEWQGELDDEAHLLVDALLGSGLQRDLDGKFAKIVEAINVHLGGVMSLDIPTGLNGNSGQIMGTAVVADLTVTFVGLKAGLFIGSAARCVGEIAFAGLGIPADCRDGIPVQMRRIDDTVLQLALPPRQADAHKGDFGHLLLIGGGPGMPGAVRLAGAAALRSGAGRVTVATHPGNVVPVAADCPELMFRAVAEAADLADILSRVDTIAIGPGLGTGEWARQLLDVALDAGLPLVLDADALNLLPTQAKRAKGWILTPHPGEAARLLDSRPAAIQKDRPKALADLKERYGGTIVLKGAGTLVSAENGPCWLCTAGNPGMAAPGMGDVLTGIIAGLVAQGLAAELAAVCGVLAHAHAGDAAAKAGQRGLMASDLLPELRTLLNP